MNGVHTKRGEKERTLWRGKDYMRGMEQKYRQENEPTIAEDDGICREVH